MLQIGDKVNLTEEYGMRMVGMIMCRGKVSAYSFLILLPDGNYIWDIEDYLIREE